MLYIRSLNMLTAIEGCLEQLFETIETLPADKVEAAEKARFPLSLPQPYYKQLRKLLVIFSLTAEGEREEDEAESTEDGGTEAVPGAETAEDAGESPRRTSPNSQFTSNNTHSREQSGSETASWWVYVVKS